LTSGTSGKHHPQGKGTMTDQVANGKGEVSKLYERFGEFMKAKKDEREDLFTGKEIAILENLGKQSRLVEIDFQNKWKVLSRSHMEAEEDQAKGKFWFIEELYK
jgi:hypothetical protein